MDQHFIDAIKNLSRSQFKQLDELLAEKDELKTRLEQVEHDIQIVAKGGSLPRRRRSSSAVAAPVSSGKPGRSPKIKESVISLLKEAGEKGLGVKEISEKLNKKSTHLHSWFHSTGSKIPEIKKVDKARYTYTAAK